MILGNKGVSKSTGFLLAWYLSSVITEFRFENKSMVENLVRKNLIQAYFGKILYVSFNVGGDE
jgi:hypothetical protein